MSTRPDDDDLIAAVRGITVTDPLPPTDPAALATRGRRGLRRRRLLAGAGSTAAVAAIAASTTLLPSLNSAETPPVAGTPSTTATSAKATKPAVSGDAALLNRCGVAVRRDLSGWRIVAKAEEKDYLISVAALAPSGKQAATCYLAGRKLPGEIPSAWNTVSGVSAPPKDVETQSYEKSGTVYTVPRHMFETGAVTCGQPGHTECVGFLFNEIGRLPVAAARIHAVASNGRAIDVPVKEGWYAVAWGDGNRDGMHPVDWKVYDAKGKLLGSKPR